MAFLHCRGPEVVFRGDEDEAVGLRDRGGPSANDLVLERRATRHGRRQWLIEERHRKVAQIEQPRVDAIALLQVPENPVRGLFRETALAGASDNDGNDAHGFNPCYQMVRTTLPKGRLDTRPEYLRRLRRRHP